MPHVSRALRLNLQLGKMNSRNVGIESALHLFNIAVFGLDSTGSVIFQNGAAEEIARAGDGIKLVRGKLRLRNIKQDGVFQTMLAGASPRTCMGGFVAVARQAKSLPLLLSIVPLAASLTSSLKQMTCLVFATDRSRVPSSRAASMRALFGLTPTEAKLADALASGMDVKVAAESLGLTENTTRFHLKETFRKTGVRSQSALLRLILSLPAAA